MLSSAEKPMAVLLVDGLPEDAARIVAALGAAPGSYRVDLADGLDAALERADGARHDAILLDLSVVRDPLGGEIERTRSRAPGAAVVVLDRSENPETARELIRAGAHDYLVLDQATPATLARVIRCAIERHRRERRHARTRQSRRHRRELSSLGCLSGPGSSAVTAALFGQGPLERTHPREFRAFREAYGDLVEARLEESVFKAESGVRDVRERTRALARHIGHLRGGARDVVDLHLAVLRPRLRAAATPQRQALLEEGRLLALELMGHLVSYYRNRSIGAPAEVSAHPLPRNTPPAPPAARSGAEPPRGEAMRPDADPGGARR
jgi:DNA-binding NarL/FixJ family response regulator